MILKYTEFFADLKIKNQNKQKTRRARYVKIVPHVQRQI